MNTTSNVDPQLALSIANAESNFNQDVVSGAGAIGTMQLMPETAESLGVDPHDMKQNIEGGVKYLKRMLDAFGGDEKLAIAAYNAGPGAVQRFGGIPPYKETQDYVARVQGFKNSSPLSQYILPRHDSVDWKNLNIDDYVTYKGDNSSAGLTDLTKTKIALLARDYENTFGEKLHITAGKDEYHSGWKSWHNSGQAVDIAMESLEGEGGKKRRDWLKEQAKKYNLIPLDEYENPSAHSTGGHLHFSDHGEALDETLLNGMFAEQSRYSTPATTDETQDETQKAPQFDLNATDSETKKIFEQFVRQKREEMRDTENETMFDGMFTPKDKFDNSVENRAIIADKYGEELQNYGESKLADKNTGETTNPPKNQSSQKSEGVTKPQKIEIETPNLDVAKKAGKFFPNETYIQALKNLQTEAWKQNNNQLAMDAQEIIQNGDVAKMKDFLAKNGVQIENLIGETTEKVAQKMQRKIEKAMKPISENQVGRVAQGKIISDVAKANNVELSPTLETGLKIGSKKAVAEGQNLIRQAGIFTPQPTKENKTTNNLSENVAPSISPENSEPIQAQTQESQIVPEKLEIVETPEIKSAKAKIESLNNEFKNISSQIMDAHSANNRAMSEGNIQAVEESTARLQDLMNRQMQKQTELQQAQQELQKINSETQKTQVIPNKNEQFESVQNQTKEILNQIQSTPAKTEITPAEENTQKKVYKINQGEKSVVKDVTSQNGNIHYGATKKFGKDEFFQYKNIANAHNGKWNKTAKAFLFDRAEDRDNFLREVNNDGEVAPAENVETPKQVEEIPEDNSAQNSVELPQGYKTESGRSLNEADSQEFILKPDGSKDFGQIDDEIVAVANEKMQEDNSDFRFKTAPVRLQVGEEDKIDENGEKVEGFGYKHILEHIDQIKAKGFENIPSYIKHILKNFNEVRKSSEIENRIVLYCKGDESKGLMPLDLELEKGNDDFYTIVTAYPRRRANKKDTLLSDARPTNAPTDTASVPRLEDSNDKSGVTTSRDIAEENNVSAENIPQSEDDGKGKIEGLTGKNTKIVTDDGEEINVRYRIVEIDEVTSSDKSNYPQELQPRDRNRVALQSQVEKISNNLDPAELTNSRNANEGSPVIRSDGVVYNGNGRIMGIRKAYLKGKAENYKASLIERAEEFGFEENDISEMENPVLVREVTENLSQDTVDSLITSSRGGARMGAGEQSKIDAKKIKLNSLSKYEETSDGDLTRPGNREFVEQLLADISNDAEMNAYLDKDGNINADGITRIKRALIALAYGDDSIISKMAESTDDNIRNITTALQKASPNMAKIRVKMNRGTLPDYDLSAITDAANKLTALRNENKPVKKYLDEQKLFAEDAEEMRKILSFFDDNKRNGKKITQFLKGIAERIESQGNPNQVTMFGETEPQTLSEIIDDVERILQNPQEGLKFSGKGNLDFEIKNPSVANVALQLGGDIKDGHLTFKNPKDEETFRKHLQNLNGGNIKLSFAGKKAKTADLESLNKAKKLEQQGRDRDEIYQKTGWFKGKDGKWRFEIPDHREQMNIKRLVERGNFGKPTLLEEIYDNQELYAAYPKLRNVKIAAIEFDEGNLHGETLGDSITLDADAIYLDPEEVEKTLVHEIQHVIQDYEDFARGGNIQYIKTILNLNRNLIKKSVNKIPNGRKYFDSMIAVEKSLETKDKQVISKVRAEMQAAKQEVSQKDQPKVENFYLRFRELKNVRANNFSEKVETYERLGGEQESRQVEERLDNRDGTPIAHYSDALIVYGGKTYSVAKNSDSANKKSPYENYNGELVLNGNMRGQTSPSIVTADDTTNRKPSRFDVQSDNKGGVRQSDANVETNSPRASVSQIPNNSNQKYSKIESFVNPKDLNAQQKNLAGIGRSFGTPIIFFKGSQNLNGVHDLDSGITYINVDSPINPKWIFEHESYHWLTNLNPKLHEEILKAVKVTDEQLDAKRKDRPELSDEELKEEIIADAFSDTAERAKLFQDIGKKNKTLLAKIISWLKSAYDKFVGFFKSKPTTQGEKFSKDKVENLLTPAQQNAMYKTFVKNIRSYKDANGNRIFRVSNYTGDVEYANGDKLPQTDLQLFAENSIDNAENLRDNADRKINDYLTVTKDGAFKAKLFNEVPLNGEETSQERIKRRENEVANMDKELNLTENPDAYAQLLSDHTVNEIKDNHKKLGSWISLAERYKKLYQELLATTHKTLLVEQGELGEEGVVSALYNLKGMIRYAERQGIITRGNQFTGRFKSPNRRIVQGMGKGES